MEVPGLPPGEYLIHVGVETGSRWDPIRIPFWYPAAARPEDAAIVRIGASTRAVRLGEQDLELVISGGHPGDAIPVRRR